jgi:hypothetical protein
MNLWFLILGQTSLFGFGIWFLGHPNMDWQWGLVLLYWNLIKNIAYFFERRHFSLWNIYFLKKKPYSFEFHGTNSKITHRSIIQVHIRVAQNIISIPKREVTGLWVCLRGWLQNPKICKELKVSKRIRSIYFQF